MGHKTLAKKQHHMNVVRWYQAKAMLYQAKVAASAAATQHDTHLKRRKKPQAVSLCPFVMGHACPSSSSYKKLKPYVMRI